MFMNPLAVLRGGLAAAGAVLVVLASVRWRCCALPCMPHWSVPLGALLSPDRSCGYCTGGRRWLSGNTGNPSPHFSVAWWKDSAAAGPISAAFEPLKPVFQWIGDKVQALWGWFTDLLTPVKSTLPNCRVQRQWAAIREAPRKGWQNGHASAGLPEIRRFLLLEKLGIVSKEAAKAKLPEA